MLLYTTYTMYNGYTWIYCILAQKILKHMLANLFIALPSFPRYREFGYSSEVQHGP